MVFQRFAIRVVNSSIGKRLQRNVESFNPQSTNERLIFLAVCCLMLIGVAKAGPGACVACWTWWSQSCLAACSIPVACVALIPGSPAFCACVAATAAGYCAVTAAWCTAVCVAPTP